MPLPSDDQDVRIGRPPRISREAIAAAALKIGLDRATVQRIGEELGVDHSSLYRHVRGRKDIMMATADLAIARLDWRIDTDDWRQLLLGAAEAVWALYQNHPGLAEAIRELDETPPSGVVAFAETVRRLESYGFARVDAMVVVDSIMDMTADSVSAWHTLFGRERKGQSGERIMASGWDREAENNPDFSSQIREMGGVIKGDPKVWWRRKLDLLLAGAEAFLAAKAR
jgi:AcrR family transcriptional regulator